MSGSTTSSGSGATRDPSQTPFSSDSVFNLPIGSNAQWGYNDQLANAQVFVNTTETGYTENIYTGTGNDPLVTVYNSGAAGGDPGTFQVHIPSDAAGAAGNDGVMSVDDTTSGTWYSFGGFNWTGSNSATASSGSAEPDSGSGTTQYGSNFDEGVGTLRQSDIASGTINHMLRIELPTNMVQAVGSNFTDLVSYAWPQTQEDGFAVNGNGGTPYSGSIPYGVTVGIPADTPEPADIAANPGADMLWQALRDHGAMIRDTTGDSGNTVVLQADQNVDPGSPLVQGMDQFGSEIMSAARILTNQGPDSVNGGGTPIVAMDPPVGGASGSGNSGNGNSGNGSGTGTSATVAGSGSDSGSGSGTGTDTTGTAGTTTGTDTSGSSGGGTSDTATITPDTLSGGQSGSGSNSGMSFVAAPTSTDPSGNTSSGSGSGSGSDTTSGSNAAPASGLDTGSTSSNDFTAPVATGTSDPTSGSGSGGGYSHWLAHHPQAAQILASQQQG